MSEGLDFNSKRARSANRKDLSISYYDRNAPTARQVAKAYRQEKRVLLIWIKWQEVWCRERGRNEVEYVASERAYAKAEAYKDVWRNILFAGKSLELNLSVLKILYTQGALSKKEYDELVAELETKSGGDS